MHFLYQTNIPRIWKAHIFKLGIVLGTHKAAKEGSSLIAHVCLRYNTWNT